jgi:hypothetical protein
MSARAFSCATAKIAGADIIAIRVASNPVRLTRASPGIVEHSSL